MTGQEWLPPAGFRVSSEADLEELISDENVARVIDPIAEIADDLFELHHPDQMGDEAARSKFVAEITSQSKKGYGTWFLYPWDRSLVHFPAAADYYDLRTFRNRDLITNDEQRTGLRRKKIAAFGLSVGRSVVENTVQSGIGNTYLLFDFDRVSPSNLNRLDAGMEDVGLLKTTSVGRKISRVDPYLHQIHYTSGYDAHSDDFLRRERPDVIVDEVDDLEVKARLRRIAAELKIPVVMTADVDDKSVMHVERHDLEVVAPFNGVLPPEIIEQMITGKLPIESRNGVLIAMLGGQANISQRLLGSVGLIGKEIAGLPQLKTTAAIGGALTAATIRDILLGRSVPSGMRVQDTAAFIRGAEN